MKTMTGTVIDTKSAQTAKVEVKRHWRHPLYKKTVTRSKRYLVQDDIGVSIGDNVRIQETRPKSKRKRFAIVKKLEKTTSKSRKEAKKGGK